jgi:hypothetical protein
MTCFSLACSSAWRHGRARCVRGERGLPNKIIRANSKQLRESERERVRVREKEKESARERVRDYIQVIVAAAFFLSHICMYVAVYSFLFLTDERFCRSTFCTLFSCAEFSFLRHVLFLAQARVCSARKVALFQATDEADSSDRLCFPLV